MLLPSSFLFRSLAAVALATSVLAPSAYAGGPRLPLEAFLSLRESAYLLSTPGSQKTFAQLAERLTLGESAKGVASVAASAASKEELIQLVKARIERPEFHAERVALEERLGQIHEGIKAHTLSDAQAQELFSKPLSIPPATGAKGFRGASEEFLHSRTSSQIVKAVERVGVRQGPPPPAAEIAANAKNFQMSLSEMRTCLSAKPAEELKKIKIRYLTDQLWVDEVMTMGGAVLSAGSLHNVDWKTLPSDLAFEGLASLGDSLIATMPKMPKKVDVRWYVLQLFGVGQSGVDAVVYSISQPEESRKVSVKDRFIFNTGWNAAYGKFSLGVYDMIAGLECLEAPRALRIGALLGAGLGSNFVYFESRSRILGTNAD